MMQGSKARGTRKPVLDSAGWGHRALAVLALVLVSTIAEARSPKIAKDLGAGSGTVNVIVQFTQAPSAKHFDKVLKKGGKLQAKLHSIKAGAFAVPASALEDLASDPDVLYISPDRPVQRTLDNAVEAVAASVARDLGYDGSGIGVAVLDSGMLLNDDFRVPGSSASRIVYSQNFVSSGSDTTSDLFGHGTHVAGIIGGNAKNSECSTCDVAIRGMAPNVNLINLRVLDANGVGKDSAVIAAIQRAIELKNTYNIRVINLSLGRGIFESYKTDPLTLAVESAWKAGMVVVVSGGNYGRDNSNNNNGYATITSPGNDPYVITVGAMKTEATAAKTDDAMASYSSKGPTLLDHVVKPDLVAPGNRIVSALASGSALSNAYPQNVLPLSYYHSSIKPKDRSDYFRLSGTSMAAPMVSGAVALLLDKNPSLTPDQVKARLMKTAWKSFPATSTAIDPASGMVYTIQNDIFTVGAGYLDIQAALASTALASGSVGVAKSPLVGYNSTTGQVYLVSDSSVMWGSSVAWGTSVVWGTSVIWGTNLLGQSVLWGNSVAWGASTNQGFSVIWGASASKMSVMWGCSAGATEANSIAIEGED